MIFSSALSLRVFPEGDEETSEIPTTLEECCLKLDEILSQEEKHKIIQSSVTDIRSYLRHISLEPLGIMIKSEWLRVTKDDTTALYTLFVEHGAYFAGGMELSTMMLEMILENYRHYLLTGESVESIEDLAIDYWFNWERCFDPSAQREFYEEKMERWKKAKESRKQSKWSIISKCNII